MTRAEAFEFLSARKLGVVCSISPEGDPQSAVVGIAVTAELDLIFDTLSSSRKYRNLSANPRCAVTAWDGAVTVQYEGEAWELSGEQLARYQPVYFAAWPDGPSRLSWPGITYFVVRPRWIRYSDFAVEPARIEDVELG